MSRNFNYNCYKYACPVWAPHSHKDIHLIERVQMFGVKIISGEWNAAYHDCLDQFGLVTLERRRLDLSLCLLYKYVNSKEWRNWNGPVVSTTTSSDQSTNRSLCSNRAIPRGTRRNVSGRIIQLCVLAFHLEERKVRLSVHSSFITSPLYSSPFIDLRQMDTLKPAKFSPMML